MKKFTAILTAITMLSVCVSCSSENVSSETKPQNQSFTAETISRTYKRSRSELPEKLDAVYRMTPYADGGKLFILGASMEKTPVFYTADSKLENFSSFDIPDFIAGNSYDLDISSDGSVTAVSVTGSEDEEYKIYVSRFSESGETISYNEISGIYDAVSPENAMINGVYTSSDGKYFIVRINNDYYSADTDGNFIGKLDTDSEIEQFGKDSDGNIVCMLGLGDSKYKICTVNPENLTLSENGNEYTFNDGTVSGIIPAKGDYSMYIPCRKNIYAIKKDGSAVPVFDVFSSGINANTLSDFFFDESGSLVIPENDYSNFSVKMVRYSECDPSDLEDIPVLSVGIFYDDPWIAEYITDINDSQSDYRIELKNYGEYSDEKNPNGNYEKLSLDLISGDSPDVIYGSSNDGGFIQEYGLDKKGAFVDLYGFMENDRELNKDMFLPNILELFETDDHLYSISNSFYISASLGKTDVVGEKKDWNCTDYINAYENKPDDMGMFYYDEEMTKYSMWNMLFNLTDYIDLNSAECFFNSEEYVEILEYCNKFPLEAQTEITSDWGELNEEEQLYKLEYQVMQYRSNKAMIYDNYISGYQDYYAIKEGDFGGEDITFIKKPEADFVQNIEISSCSDKKELAWEFVKTLFSSDTYRNTSGLAYGMPIIKSELEYAAVESMKPRKYVDSDYDGLMWGVNKSTFEIGLPDQKTIDELNEIISDIDSSTYYNSDINIIAYEESQKFFNGDCTAKECAETTQNRVSIYLAENQ